MLKDNTKNIAQLFNTTCKSLDFAGISIDSRDCKNQLFVAIIGDKFNAHNFVDDAIKNGAVAVVASEKLKCNIPIIYVDDTTKSLGTIANYHRKNINAKIIAITGSNGKTTTKNMLFNIFSQVAPTLKTFGNFNNHIGVPLTLLNLELQHKFAIIEMGANHLGEIEYLRDIANPDIACVINTLDAHIGEFGGFENLVKAKHEIYSDKSINIINKKTNIIGDISFGVGGYIDYNYLKNIKLQLLGKHNQENALAAIACCKALKIDDKFIKKGLEKTTAEAGRLELITAKNYTIINDSYNASPSSSKYALDVLSEFTGIKVAVLGNIAELGDKSCEIHAKIGEYAKTLNINYLYSVGELAKNYGILHFKNHKDLLQKLNLHTGATVLFKGSRAAGLEKIINLL